jgi:hypothetical protein
VRVAVVALVVAACGTGGRASVDAQLDSDTDVPVPVPVPVPDLVDGHDFTAEARALMDVALCAGEAKQPRDTRYCARIEEIRDTFRTRWIEPARRWFPTLVPAGLPTSVVYPFAGGDLATVLTVFPDATEITTLSLEPGGDPRTVHTLDGWQMRHALSVIADQLGFLYSVNFSNTKDLIGAMRGASLPTQLVFSLSALDLCGYELDSLRYFALTPEGDIHYLDDADIAKAPPVEDLDTGDRNHVFGNTELRFHKAGETTVRVHRHIEWNLDDAHLGSDDRVLRHLSKKGQVAAMTKAASYLLGWPNFSLIRGWLIEHAVWMVSDASGIPPQFARPAGLVQEVWGSFSGSHMKAGLRSDGEYRKLFASQPTRPIPVRFGYPDVTRKRSHMIVTRRQ